MQPHHPMHRVDFHVNVADTLTHCWRLLRKIYRTRQRVVVCTTQENWAQQLDDRLWAADPAEFLPHVYASNPLADQTPIILHTCAQVPAGPFDVLVNVGPELAAGFERCPRIIEVVGQNETARHHGRARWRHYRAFGLTPQSHDLTSLTTPAAEGGS